MDFRVSKFFFRGGEKKSWLRAKNVMLGSDWFETILVLMPTCVVKMLCDCEVNANQTLVY